MPKSSFKALANCSMFLILDISLSSSGGIVLLFSSGGLFAALAGLGCG